MNNHLTSPETVTCTAGGTLLVILMQVPAAQLFNTIILAAVGALVSFLVSMFCKFLSDRFNKDQNSYPD